MRKRAGLEIRIAKGRNVSKAAFNLKYILQNKCGFNIACLFIV